MNKSDYILFCNSSNSVTTGSALIGECCIKERGLDVLLSPLQSGKSFIHNACALNPSAGFPMCTELVYNKIPVTLIKDTFQNSTAGISTKVLQSRDRRCVSAASLPQTPHPDYHHPNPSSLVPNPYHHT